MRLVAFRTKER